MIRIAHIIHPVIVKPSSDLLVAQPITFESMRIAYEFVRNLEEAADISLYSIQYHDEDRIPLPECFTRVPDLQRSVTDIKTFLIKRKLALIKDILDVLYNTAIDADYLIYTNVDIALQPFFYLTVSKFIRQGFDAFVINRRTISDKYSHIDKISLMYAETGQSHKGYDCFVFKRNLYPEFKSGNICIGTAWIGRALLANMVTYGKKFKEFKDEHLTFHIGDPVPWRKDKYKDYLQENRNEYLKIFNQLESENGKFEPILHSYLLDGGIKRQYPHFL